MAKNILKKSLALGVLMTFLITGSVWAAEENNTNNLITDDGANIFVGNSSKPPSSGSITVTNVVAMGKNITYSDGSENLVLLGKDVDANGNRLVYIGSNINKTPSQDDIKEAITKYLTNLDGSTQSNDSNNVAIGSLISITGKNSVAIGMGVNVEANNAIAIGSGSAVAEGENGTVSFGRGEAGSETEITRRLTHIEDGLKVTDAVNKGQLDKESEIRESTDAYLQEQISSNDADITNLGIDIHNEKTARESTDAYLQEQISSNDADITNLGIDIHNERTARIEADKKGDVKSSYYNASAGTLDLYNEYGEILAQATDIASKTALEKETTERISADNLINTHINRLGSRVDKVGAGAAALAALHPLDFDPDDKLQFSAGVGNYAGETATALGAFYRPTEKVMFNVSGTMGTSEDMVNAGITFALDGRNNVSNSRVAMAHEIQDLRAQVAQLTSNQAQMMALLNKVLDGQADELLANVMFPDVPENHWAYEYLNSLQKRGILKGYPDGTFGGDRSLTRYEYAAMLYRVLEQGIPVDTRLLNEFEAELGRIRIDRIKGKDDSYAKIERIRVVNNADRDDYGNKIITVSSDTAQ